VKAITIRDAVKLIGSKTSDWEGKCFGVASALAPHLGGIAVYGHWLGKINPKGYWKTRAGAPFVQHGWVVLPGPDGKYTENTETIVDPTRWSFEAKKPYLWQGKNDGAYDEGGNEMRMHLSAHDVSNDNFIEPLDVSNGCLEHLAMLLRDGDVESGLILKSQVFTIANAAPKILDWFWVAEIYEALDKAGYHGLIPTDNWRMVDRRHGLRRRDARTTP
jgi:hypothetical protein